jgi:hypothetical protein
MMRPDMMRTDMMRTDMMRTDRNLSIAAIRPSPFQSSPLHGLRAATHEPTSPVGRGQSISSS